MKWGIRVCLAVWAAGALAGEDAATGLLVPPRRPRARCAPSHQTASRVRRLASAASDSPLPRAWDARPLGWVTPVRNQNPWGTCWAFAACAVLETQMLRTGRGACDLSERNLANLHGFAPGYNDGGTQNMAMAYFLRWGGAVAETNDVYGSTWTASVPRAPALRVQNVVFVPGRTAVDDNDALKAAITNYGAVAVTYRHVAWRYADNGAYYQRDYANTATDCCSDHAVTVVGWDDDYPATNFLAACRPAGDGAWLVKNSWGSQYDGGYIHVSYHDRTFAMFDDGVVYLPATAADDYAAVYGHDRLGFADEITDPDLTLQAAVFTSAWNEEVAAVGVYSSLADAPYAVSVYTNVTRGADTPTEGGALARIQRGTLPHAGYATIPLDEPVPLADGTPFAIVYEQTGEATSHFVCYSQQADTGGGKYIDYIVCDPQARTTFLGGVSDGGATNWIDAVDYYSDGPCLVCLKAYTRATVAAAAADAPGETADGTDALAWLAATNATLHAETGETFGATARLVGANGRTLWASWLAGLDPADAADGAFTVTLTLTNAVPYLTWRPDLGTARTYTIYGKESLTNDSWTVIDDLPSTPSRFFRVEVAP